MVDGSYIRGFFDGEGSIGFTVSPRGSRSYQLSLNNTELSLLLPIGDWLRERGYHPTLRKETWRKHPNWKPCYQMRLTRTREIIRFAEEIGTNHPKHKAKFEDARAYHKLHHRAPISKQAALEAVEEMLKHSKPML